MRFQFVPTSMTFDDLEWPRRTVGEKIVLRNLQEKFE